MYCISQPSIMMLNLPTVSTLADGVTSAAFPRRTTTLMTTSSSSTHRFLANATLTVNPKQSKGPPVENPVAVDPTNAGPPPPSRRFCESTDIRGIVWPRTHRGVTVERPCPKGTRGVCLCGCVYAVSDYWFRSRSAWGWTLRDCVRKELCVCGCVREKEKKSPYRSAFPSRPELAAEAEINFGVHSTLRVNLALVIWCLFVYGVTWLVCCDSLFVD